MPSTSAVKRSDTLVYASALALPAGLSIILAILSLIGSPWAGTIFSIATGTHILTSTILGLLLIRARSSLPLGDRPLPQLEAIWLVSWIFGVFSFGLISYFFSLYQQATQLAESEGFVLSPIYWVLSFPSLVIYMVISLLVFRLLKR